MHGKDKRESQNDKTGVQGDSGVVLFHCLDTVHSEWCKPMSVENPMSLPCVISDMVKGTDVKLPDFSEQLTEAQKSETELIKLCAKALSVEEANKVSVCDFVQDYVLMSKYKPPEIHASDEWRLLSQIVVLSKYR